MQTHGWDTLYLCDLATANSALAAAADSICAPFALSDDDIALNANLDHWQIVSGGAGKLLRLQLRLQHGWVRIGTDTRALRGCTIELELALKWISDTDDAQSLRLTFDFGAYNEDLLASAPGLVTPVDFQRAPDEPDWPELHARLLSRCVAEHLASQRDLLTFVLAEVDIRGSAASEWNKPGYVDYSYIELENGESYIGVFGAGHSDEQRVTSVDPEVFKRRSPLYIVLDHDLFVEQVLLPSMPLAFPPNAQAGHFSYQPAHKRIQLAKPLPTQKVKGYQPIITSLTMTVRGNAVLMECAGTCDMNFLGVSMSFKISAEYQLTFDAASGHVGFKQTASKSSSEHHIPIATRVLFVLGLGALGVAMALVMEFVVPAVCNGIAGQLAAATGLRAFTSKVAKPVSWFGNEDLEIATVSLADSLIIEGRLKGA